MLVSYVFETSLFDSNISDTFNQTPSLIETSIEKSDVSDIPLSVLKKYIKLSITDICLKRKLRNSDMILSESAQLSEIQEMLFCFAASDDIIFDSDDKKDLLTYMAAESPKRNRFFLQSYCGIEFAVDKLSQSMMPS